MAVELEQEAEKAVGEVLQAWAAPCVDVVMGLITKARTGLSDADFRAEVEVVLSGLAEMALTDDEVLVEALWDAEAQAYRAGWVANGDDVAGSKRNCHKSPGEPCREHPDGVVRVLSHGEGKQRMRKLKTIYDWRGREVNFSKLARNHVVYGKQANARSLRVQDILFAHDTVRTGRPYRDFEHESTRDGLRRWNYFKKYKGRSDSFVMQVTCLERKNGVRDVITFYRNRKSKKDRGLS